jgi:CHAT domain-containing protein/tetratricopeptide (TPR) repeat protein
MKIEIKSYLTLALFSFFVFCFNFSHSQSTIYLNKANEYLALPDYNQALANLNKCIELSTNENNNVQLAEALNKRARVYQVKNEIALAKNDLLRAVNLAANKKNKIDCKNLIDGYLNLGNLYVANGDIEEAGDYFKKSDSLTNKYFPNEPSLRALTYKGLSSYHGFKVEIDSEYYYANKAYTLLPKLDQNDIAYVEILMRYAYAYKVKFREGNDGYFKCYPVVRELYQQSISTLDKIYSRPSYQKAACLHGLANSYSDFIHSNIITNKSERKIYFDKAKHLYQKSLAIKKSISGDKSSDYSVSCYTMALLHQSYNDNANALIWYNTAIDCINEKEMFLLHLKGNEKLITKDPYSLNILLTNRNNIYTKQYLAKKDIHVLEKIHAANLERIILWRQIFATYQSKDLGSVIALWNHTPFEEAIHSAYQLYEITHDKEYLIDIFYFAEESRNNDFIREFLQKNKTGENKIDMFPEPIQLERLKSICKINEAAFIEIVYNKKYGYQSYLISVDSSQLFIHAFSTTESDSLINGLQSSMKKNDCQSYESYAFQLYQLILEKTLQQLSGVNKLIISSGGAFHDLSFEALVNKKVDDNKNDFRKLNYLLHKYTISYALSASVLNYQLRKSSVASKKISAFCANVNDKADLLFSKTLFDRIRNDYDGHFFEGKETNVSSFLSNTKSQNVLQLFSHAKADKNNYENTILYLSGSKNEGLSMANVYGHVIQSNLTVLACCESGSGIEKYGEGVKSLIRAFTFSGSKSVIGTLWSVDEKSTISILDQFYDFLSSTGKISESLKNSKLEYLSQCKSSDAANPFYWTGLVATGDVSQTNKITLTDSGGIPFNIPIYLITLASLIFIFVVLNKLRK